MTKNEKYDIVTVTSREERLSSYLSGGFIMKQWEKYMSLMKERPSLFMQDGLEIISDEAVVREFEENGGREIGIIFESPWRWVLVDLVRAPSGKMFGYERVVPVKTGGVAVLPVVDGEKVILIREYRHPVQRWCWEIPRGFGTAGASALQNASKELKEETGIEEAKLSLLGQLNTDTGLTSDQVDLFLAEVASLSFSLLNKEETEVISHVRIFTIEELRRMIAEGAITDSFTLSALGIWKLVK